MARPEKTLDIESGPLARFAADLRALRSGEQGLTYRAMANRTHYSATVLSEAAAGRKLPTLAVLRAYVQACGGDVAEWTTRWHEVRAEVAPPASQPAVEPEPVRRGPNRSRVLLVGSFAALLVALLAVTTVLVVVLTSADDPSELDGLRGKPVAGGPPAGLPCVTTDGARACLDREAGLFWVKDALPGDGHHAAVYWRSTDGDEVHGDCHNYMGSRGPWVTCPYLDKLRDQQELSFRAMSVEMDRVLKWGPAKVAPAI